MNKTSRGSFSAVSTPIFASKYSLESSRRDLHNALESNPPMKRNGRKEENALLCTVLQTQNFSQKSPTFFRDWIIEFPIFFIFFVEFAFFLRIFDDMFSGFRAKFQKRVTSVAFQSILRKQIRKLPKIENSEICENYSIFFNIIHSCP